MPAFTQALDPSSRGDRSARSESCNLAGRSAVYIFGRGVSGRLAARRLGRTLVAMGNRAAEERGKLQTSLQQACNMPAFTLQPWMHSSVALVVLRG
jgi:hypothetical protein